MNPLPAFAIHPDRPGPDLLVLSVQGDIDLATASVFEQRAREEIHESDTSVVVDLTDCHFIDSSGLAMLLRMCVTLEGRDAKFAVAAGANAVRRVMSLSALDTRFPVADDLEAAIAATAGVHEG